jgi:hypothetical protein
VRWQYQCFGDFNMNFEPQIIGIGISLVAACFAGGMAWGKHETRIKTLERLGDKCDFGELMTVERCRQYHADRQEATDVQLREIKATLKEIKSEKQDLVQIGALNSKLDSILGRLVTENG